MKHFSLRREITVIQLYYGRRDKRSTVFGFVYLLLLNPAGDKIKTKNRQFLFCKILNSNGAVRVGSI